jgi:GTP-binding protein
LTRLKPNKRILEDTATEKRKKMEIQDNVGAGFGVVGGGGSKTFDPKFLPGTKFMDPEEDPSQFSHQISEFALVSALNALRFAQVVLLVVEGGQGKFSKIDLQLARKCLDEGRALVIAGNKKDLIGISTKEYEAGIAKHCESFMKDFGDVPVIACSASQGSGVGKILRAVVDTHDAWSRRVSTWVLNRWLKDLMIATPPPRVGGKSIVVRYMTQVKSRPPVFALFSNAPDLPGSFQRFLRFSTTDF